MNIFNKLDRYITDKEYKMIIKKDQINIINYIEIKDFSSTKIIIKTPDNIITVTGSNLVVSKMQDNEVLITGSIKLIEL